jgi:hypothetical protein
VSDIGVAQVVLSLYALISKAMLVLKPARKINTLNEFKTGNLKQAAPKQKGSPQ